MKTRNLIILISLASLVNGCVPVSLNPVYTNKNLAFEPGLIGKWSQDSTSNWTYETNNDSSYHVTYSEKDKRIDFIAHVVRIDKQYYMDLSPTSVTKENYLDHLLHMPVHAIFKMELEKNQLRLYDMNQSWIENEIKKGKVKLTHVRSEEGMFLITASSEELQQFISKHHKNAFSGVMELERIQN
ncbi:MAG: hypothetical protein ACHQF2_04580 [Flavobacteriales bacterium]